MVYQPNYHYKRKLVISAFFHFAYCMSLNYCRLVESVENHEFAHDRKHTMYVIGASLREPHTSVTALHTHVCIYAWTDHLP